MNNVLASVADSLAAALRHQGEVSKALLDDHLPVIDRDSAEKKT